MKKSYLRITCLAAPLLLSLIPCVSVAAQAATTNADTQVIRIGVALPRTNITRDGATAAAALREVLVKYLSGPAVEIVELEALAAVQQAAEARQKGCAFVLTTTFTQKKSGDMSGLTEMLKRTDAAAGKLGDLGLNNRQVQNASRVGRKSIETTADFAGSIKAKDVVTLDYNLSPIARGVVNPQVAGSVKAKAKKDGEDILGGLVEQAVNAVLTGATKQ